MFRIAFSTVTGNWEIQFPMWGFFWVSVKDGSTTPIQFETFEAAQQYVKHKGIHHAYEESYTLNIRPQQMSRDYQGGRTLQA
jgi:hypothetical protein